MSIDLVPDARHFYVYKQTDVAIRTCLLLAVPSISINVRKSAHPTLFSYGIELGT